MSSPPPPTSASSAAGPSGSARAGRLSGEGAGGGGGVRPLLVRLHRGRRLDGGGRGGGRPAGDRAAGRCPRRGLVAAAADRDRDAGRDAASPLLRQGPVGRRRR